MKNLIVTQILILTILSVLPCCKNNPNSPDDYVTNHDNESYFPMKAGNWWILEKYTIKDNMVRNDLYGRDSIFIQEKGIFKGKESYMFIIFDTREDLIKDTIYRYMEDDKLWEFNYPHDKWQSKKIWFVAADFKNNTEYISLDTNGGGGGYDNYDAGVYVGYFKTYSSKESDTVISFLGQNTKTVKVLFNYYFDGTYYMDMTWIEMKGTTHKQNYYAYGIGYIKSYYDFGSITSPVLEYVVSKYQLE